MPVVSYLFAHFLLWPLCNRPLCVILLSAVSAIAMECPITYEAFEDRGENMPIMLPACGHAISAVAAAQLVATAKAAQESKAKNMPVAIKCPSCAQTQPQVRLFRVYKHNTTLSAVVRAGNSKPWNNDTCHPCCHSAFLPRTLKDCI